MALHDREDRRLVNIDPSVPSFRVNRDAYKSKEVFEREMELIFGRCWLYVGHGSEIPKAGDFVARRVGGRDLIFSRDKSGAVNIVHNTCTHRGARICRERSGNARKFACPYHGWVFENSGKLVSMNTKAGYPEGINADGHLNLAKPAQFEEYRGFWFVNYNPKAISLHDYLADARDVLDAICEQAETEQMILQGDHSYTIRANYKLIVENSYDGYHLLSVHESYFDHLRDQGAGKLVDEMVSTYADSGKARGLGNGHGIVESYVPTGRPVAAWSPAMGEAAKPIIEARYQKLLDKVGKERADYIAQVQKNMIIFPNLVINDIVALTVRVIEPEGPDFMRVNSWAMGPKEETPELRAMRLDNYVSFLGPAGFGSPDDIEMLELCQQGMEHGPVEWSEISKGAQPGQDDPRYLSGPPNDELQIQAYWKQWDLMMANIETLER